MKNHFTTRHPLTAILFLFLLACLAVDAQWTTNGPGTNVATSYGYSTNFSRTNVTGGYTFGTNYSRTNVVGGYTFGTNYSQTNVTSSYGFSTNWSHTNITGSYGFITNFSRTNITGSYGFGTNYSRTNVVGGYTFATNYSGSYIGFGNAWTTNLATRLRVYTTNVVYGTNYSAVYHYTVSTNGLAQLNPNAVGNLYYTANDENTTTGDGWTNQVNQSIAEMALVAAGSNIWQFQVTGSVFYQATGSTNLGGAAGLTYTVQDGAPLPVPTVSFVTNFVSTPTTNTIYTTNFLFGN